MPVRAGTLPVERGRLSCCSRWLGAFAATEATEQTASPECAQRLEACSSADLVAALGRLESPRREAQPKLVLAS
jgi:hypothetical protein